MKDITKDMTWLTCCDFQGDLTRKNVAFAFKSLLSVRQTDKYSRGCQTKAPETLPTLVRRGPDQPIVKSTSRIPGPQKGSRGRVTGGSNSYLLNRRGYVQGLRLDQQNERISR